MNKKSGFTLIELITVMAITAILLTIITIPIVQGFNLTRAAQGFADAQQKARLLVEELKREISNGASVRDNTGKGGQIVARVPSDPDFDGIINSYVNVTLSGAKIDIMTPSQGDPITGPSGALRNPAIFDETLFIADTGLTPGTPAYNEAKDANRANSRYWKEDPTLRTPRGQVNLPASQGIRMVRYFISLNRPLASVTDGNGLDADQAGYDVANQTAKYNNPYDGLLIRRNGDRDNLYVLRRTEVDIRRFDSATGTWVFNTDLFSDVNADGVVDENDMDDPSFMLADGTAAKATRIRAWLKRSKVVTELSRYDMIQSVFDKRSRRVEYVGAIPRLMPLVSFNPTRVSSEPAEGGLAVRSNEETDNAAKIGPDSYSAEFGAWTSMILRTYPSSYRVPGGVNLAQPWSVYQPWEAGRNYLVGRGWTQLGNRKYSQFMVNTVVDEFNAGTEVFDSSDYILARDFDANAALPAGRTNIFRYPFSQAVDSADIRSGWLGNASLREDFIPMVADEKAGKISASFNIMEVGDGAPLPAVGDDNRPRVGTGNAASPSADLTLVGAPSLTRWQNALYSPSSATSTINQRFNVLWNDWDLIAPSLEKAKYAARFIDLRHVTCADGAISPLNPTNGFARARLVPGSEVIIGPDQIRGPNYGQAIRFTRALRSDNVGPNQYFINYVNQPEPDYAALGFAVPATIFDPTTYDPLSFVQSVLQPRFRAGYVQFASGFGDVLPTGNISITYRFQFTEPADVVAIDYDSGQKMMITLTIRNFPQTTLPNTQNVTLRGEATVRNFVR